MRITIVISVRQTGQPATISDTRMAHGSQKRACPHGTNAKPARCATRHTSQQSSEVDAAKDSDAVEVVTAGKGATDWPRPRCCCYCCCRHAAVEIPYERRLND